MTSLLLVVSACRSQPDQGHVRQASPAPAVQVGVNHGAAVVRSRTVPVLPEDARREGVKGEVILEVRIDEGGKVEVLKVVRGHPLLDALASDAARQWVFEPLIFQGKPTSVVQTLVVSFRER